MTPACGIGGGIGIGVSAPAVRQAGYAAVFSQTQPLAARAVPQQMFAAVWRPHLLCIARMSGMTFMPARVAVAQPFHIRIVLPEER